MPRSPGPHSAAQAARGPGAPAGTTSRPIKTNSCKTITDIPTDEDLELEFPTADLSLEYTGSYDVERLKELVILGADLDKIHDHSVAQNFKSYLNKTKNNKININCKNKETKENRTFIKKDVHRWTPSYFNKRLARLYKLRSWYDDQKDCPSNMWTFTVPHNTNKWGKKVRDDATHHQAWENLKQGWDRLYHCAVMKNRSYVWFIEPHPKSGYPHIHTMNFDEFTLDEQDHIKRLWHEFTGADLLEGCKYDPGKGVKHLLAYLVKYLTKTLSIGVDTWSKTDLLFNAIAHEKAYRLFGSSADLTKIMKLEHETSDNWDTLSVDLSGLEKRAIDDDINIIRLHTLEQSKDDGKLLSDYPAPSPKIFVAVDVPYTDRSWSKYTARVSRIARRVKDEPWDYGELFQTAQS